MYAPSMTAKRITISVPEEVVDKAQRAVDSGDAPNVSAYFARLAEREPDWALARQAVDQMLAEAPAATPEDDQWVRRNLELIGVADHAMAAK